ncbi:MAG TPA: hypothetical protein VIR16_00545 [Candidatus Limnocylindrales bacterium]
MGVTVSLQAPSVEVEPGTEAVLEVKLRNNGSVVDEFALDVLGDAAGWAVAEPASISLFPGAEGNATIHFRPPRAPSTPAGPVPFGLRARSREDAAGSAVEEGTVVVGAFVEPFAELVPRTSRGSGGASHEVAVDNRGNVRLSAEVSGTDADRLLRFDVTPPGVVVEPGGASFAKVRVRPVRRFWRGQPKTRPFQLFVTPEGRGPIQLDGTLLQEAILPSWFGRLIALLLGALLVLALLWLFVLKPAINSAVGEAVASPMASLRSDVNSALSGAGLPTMGAGGAGSASPTPAPTVAPGASPTPATPTASPGVVIVGLGTPVDGRLDDSNKTVSPTGTLFLTDLVFSNPNGTTGAMVVMRNTTPLLQLKLDNFRDYDLHFVTPIVITAGQQLNLSLSCTSSPCDPAVFYSGYQRP